MKRWENYWGGTRLRLGVKSSPLIENPKSLARKIPRFRPRDENHEITYYFILNIGHIGN